MKQEDFEKLSTDDQVAYWKGRMLIAIGKGDMDLEIFRMMDYFSRIGFQRGVDSTKRK